MIDCLRVRAIVRWWRAVQSRRRIEPAPGVAGAVTGAGGAPVGRVGDGGIELPEPVRRQGEHVLAHPDRLGDDSHADAHELGIAFHTHQFGCRLTVMAVAEQVSAREGQVPDSCTQVDDPGADNMDGHRARQRGRGEEHSISALVQMHRFLIAV